MRGLAVAEVYPLEVDSRRVECFERCLPKTEQRRRRWFGGEVDQKLPPRAQEMV